MGPPCDCRRHCARCAGQSPSQSGIFFFTFSDGGVRCAGRARRILSVVAGLAAWFVVATILDFVLRLALPGYHEAEPTMAFTLTDADRTAREGRDRDACAGLTTALVAQGNRTIVMVLGALLVLALHSVHYQLRDAFPSGIT